MVPQVLAHPGQVVHHFNAKAADVFRRTHAREQQQVGRPDGAAADHYLLPLNGEHLAAALRLHAHGPLPLEQDAPGRNAAPHGQVQPVPGLLQVGQGHAHPHPVDGVAGPG